MFFPVDRECTIPRQTKNIEFHPDGTQTIYSICCLYCMWFDQVWHQSTNWSSDCSDVRGRYKWLITIFVNVCFVCCLCCLSDLTLFCRTLCSLVWIWQLIFIDHLCNVFVSGFIYYLWAVNSQVSIDLRAALTNPQWTK